MINPGIIEAFDKAESKLKTHIYRAATYSALIKSSEYLNPDVDDLYRFYLKNELEAAKKLIVWCWDHGYLDRFEAAKIAHWLIWFDFPEDSVND